MKLFIDTANIDEIKEIKEWGILEGVTTNPSLIAREGDVDFKEVITRITYLVPGPISAEVISTDSKGMIEEARELAGISENIVIKIPMTEDGMAAVDTLSSEGIKTNVTLVFSANQALIAARAGATFVSPFIGRLDDIGHDGMQVVRDICQVYNNYGIKSQIIAASIRHPRHVLLAAKAGADIATIPYGIFKKMIGHPKTDEGLEKFLADWQDR